MTATIAPKITVPRELWLKFITAGMAHFTVHNPRTNQHLHVHITHSKLSPTWRYVRAAGVEVGKLAYNGLSDTWVWIPKPEVLAGGSSDVKRALAKFQWFWNKVVDGTHEPQIQVLHLGRCGKCGRDLTDPKSISMGIGPECRKSLGL